MANFFIRQNPRANIGSVEFPLNISASTFSNGVPRTLQTPSNSINSIDWLVGALAYPEVQASLPTGTVSTWVSLTDTPATLTPNFIPQVNAGGTAITLVDPTTLGGTTSFTGLTDTPGALGAATQLVAVNAGGTALEFVNSPTVINTIVGLTDTPAGFGTVGQVLAVNAAANAVEWITPSTVTNFLALTDTPGTFGTAGQVATVNAGATALEFTTIPTTTVEDLLTSVSTSNALSANQGRVLKVEQDNQTSVLGTTSGDTDLGGFTGTTITDNVAVKVALQELETALEAIPNGLTPRGTWNADTNTPALASGTPFNSIGDYFIVGTAGTTTLDGISTWAVGDNLFFGADNTWHKVDDNLDINQFLQLVDTPAAFATGDTYYSDGVSMLALPIGTAGQVLTINAGATAPEWANTLAANITEGTLNTATTARTANFGGNDLTLTNSDNTMIEAGDSISITATDGDALLASTNSSAVMSGINGASLSVGSNIFATTAPTGAFRLPTDADPDTNVISAQNGMLKYDSTDHDLRAYVNGAWVSMLADTNLFTPGGLNNTALVTHTDNFGWIMQGAGIKVLTTDAGIATTTISSNGASASIAANDAGNNSSVAANPNGTIVMDSNTGTYQLTTAPGVIDSDSTTSTLLVREDGGNVQGVDFDRFSTLSGAGDPVDGTDTAWYAGQLRVNTTDNTIDVATTASTNPDAAPAGSVWASTTVQDFYQVNGGAFDFAALNTPNGVSVSITNISSSNQANITIDNTKVTDVKTITDAGFGSFPAGTITTIQVPINGHAILTETDTTTLVSIFPTNGDRVFVDETTLAPAIAGSPTKAELSTYAGNQGLRDEILVYNGTDTDNDIYTHVFWVDFSQNITILRQPLSEGLRGAPVADNTALTALTAKEYELRLVKSTNIEYVFKLTADLTTEEDANPANLADNAGTGKWISQAAQPNADARVTLIDVDAVNGTLYTFSTGETWADIKNNYEYLIVTGNASQNGASNVRPYSKVLTPANIDLLTSNTGSYVEFDDGLNSVNIGIQAPSDTDTGFTTLFSGHDAPASGRMQLTVIGVRSQTVVIDPASLVTDDQSASGYIDLGDTRIQWGMGATTSGAAEIVNLPVPFADANYSVSGTSDGATFYIRAEGFTTTQWSVQVLQPDPVLGVAGNYRWQAIGLKP